MKFTARCTALADMIAYVEVEADTPEAAVEAARAMIEAGEAEFDIADEGAVHLSGTEEVECITGEEETELLLPTVDGAYLARAVSEYHTDRPHLIALSPAELATVLAALRTFQHGTEHLEIGLARAIDDIETNGGKLTSLSVEDIDDLCERLNVAP